MLYYFPSCKFTAAFPEASRKIKDYLFQKPNVIIAGCCRPGQNLLTANDTALTTCTTCAIITREVSPQAQEMSIFRYLLTDKAFPWPDLHGEAIAIQDCWRARNDPALHDAVRACMRKMHITPVELPENRESTQFDGMWRFNPVAAGNLAIAPNTFSDIRDNAITLLPQPEQLRRMREHVQSIPTGRVAAYCNACVAGLRAGGADAVHLMELAVRNL